MNNDSFTIPRITEKIRSIQAVQSMQFVLNVGNYPNQSKYIEKLTDLENRKVLIQHFKSKKAKIKALGLYFQVDFRAIGEAGRKGIIRAELYEWQEAGGVINFIPVSLDNGKPATVEVEISSVQNLDETIFEFEDYLTVPSPGTTEYVIVMTWVAGYSEDNSIFVLSDASSVNSGEAYYVNWKDGKNLTDVQVEKIEPYTNFAFKVYQSIAALAVELSGEGGRSLTDIYDALSVGDAEDYDTGLGVIDYQKPLSSHDTLYVSDSGFMAGSLSSGATVNWANINAISLGETKSLAVFQIMKGEVQINWAKPGDTKNLANDFLVLQNGDKLVISEYMDKIYLRKWGSENPEISCVFWRMVK